MKTPQDEWDNRFMNLAKTVASWSKDPNRKVGCVIVDDNHNILTAKYNGFPTGISDTKELLENQEFKRLYMVHAEMNALLHVSVIAEGATLYCTSFPCNSCAAVIVQTGIEVVIAPAPNLNHVHWGPKYKASLEMFKSAEITVHYYKNKLTVVSDEG